MANKEESIIEKVERELSDFLKKKTESTTALNSELKTAEQEYLKLKSEIEAKYNVSELDTEISKHTYFLKLLKGEVPIPDDLNAKKSRMTFSIKSKRQPKNWNDKFDAAYKALLPEEKPDRKDVFAKVAELYPDVDVTTDKGKNQINAALGSYKRANNLN